MTMLMTKLMTTLRTGLAAISKRLGPPYAKLRVLVRKPSFQRGAFAVAVILFVGGLWFSIKARPDLLEQLHPGRFLTIVFIFSPLILGLNAAIFRSIAEIGNVRFTWAEAIKLTVLSSALNHLPAPGGPVLRIAAMRERGGDIVTASALTFGSALVWFGATFLFAGGIGFAIAPGLGAACIAAGCASLVAGSFFCWRVRRKFEDAASIFLMSAAMVVIYALTLWVGFGAFNAPVAFSEAGVVSGAGVIGAAASFLPAGIGAREAAGAFLASRINVDPFTAFAATALVQIAMMILLAIAAACFSVTGNFRASPEPQKP